MTIQTTEGFIITVHTVNRMKMPIYIGCPERILVQMTFIVIIWEEDIDIIMICSCFSTIVNCVLYLLYCYCAIK